MAVAKGLRVAAEAVMSKSAHKSATGQLRTFRKGATKKLLFLCLVVIKILFQLCSKF